MHRVTPEEGAARPRLLLDTNVWSMLGRIDGGPAFYAAMAEAGVEVVLAPSILLELARSGNVVASGRDVRAMLAGPRRALPTEAELACHDVITQVRRLHPGWLRPDPDVARWKQLHRYWTVELWHETRQNWPAVVKQVRTLPTADADAVYAVQRENHKVARDAGETSADWYSPAPTSPGWLRDLWPPEPGLAAWRSEGHGIFSLALAEAVQGNLGNGTLRTLADWLETHIDPRRITDRAWAQFWISEIEAADVPHHWLANTAQRQQVLAKVTSSSPRDAQHASYLVQCDLFLTGDRRFAACLQDMAGSAPFDFAEVVQVPGDASNLIAELRACVGAASGNRSSRLA
ncbi:hypothetical protein [Geodermatophilus siccatus]|uniref:hypothetical protein n=1 Tax=Geodermatophilus siccatus TaxID=1137991 RepID=UPI0011132FB6|nr:hypothetical protein [Geodermatophilus siccatus]